MLVMAKTQQLLPLTSPVRHTTAAQRSRESLLDAKIGMGLIAIIDTALPPWRRSGERTRRSAGSKQVMQPTRQRLVMLRHLRPTPHECARSHERAFVLTAAGAANAPMQPLRDYTPIRAKRA
jgi:hypothetical protein